MDVLEVTKDNYQELIEIWEASVRATHDFLPEESILELKPLILQHYFDAVALRCTKQGEKIIDEGEGFQIIIDKLKELKAI